MPARIELVVETGENLFRALRRHGQPIASSCGGDGVCDKCRRAVIDGMQNLSAPGDIENSFRAQRPFTADERMACRVFVHGDVTITTGYW